MSFDSDSLKIDLEKFQKRMKKYHKKMFKKQLKLDYMIWKLHFDLGMKRYES